MKKCESSLFQEELRLALQGEFEKGANELILDFSKASDGGFSAEDRGRLDTIIRDINNLKSERYINQHPAPITSVDVKKGKVRVTFGNT